MKKIFVFLIINFIFISNVCAAYTYTDVNVYDKKNSNFEGVSESKNNEYVIVGGNNDALIVKYNFNKEVVWSKTYGGSDIDYLYDVELVDGGYVAVGYTTSTDISNNMNNGLNDGYIIKVDNDGNLLWQKTFGGNKNDVFYDVEVLVDGGYIVVGSTLSTNLENITAGGYEDGLIVKYDKDGNLKYTKTISGNKNDVLRGVGSTKDGGYIVTGSSYSTNLGLSVGLYGNALLYKYDKDNVLEWTQTVGSNTTPVYGNNYGLVPVENEDLALYDVIQTSDGGYATVGALVPSMVEITPASYGSNSFYVFPSIIKYNSNGVFEWGKSFSEDNFGIMYDVVESSDKSLWTVGNYKSKKNSLIVNYSSDGTLLDTYSSTSDGIAYNKNIEMLYDNYFISVGSLNAKNISFSLHVGPDLLEGKKSFVRGEVENDYYEGYIYTCDKAYDMINTSTDTNGKVTLLRKNGKGLINIVSNSGYKIDLIKVVDFNNNEVEITRNTDGSYSFSLNTDVSVSTSFREVIIKKDETLEDNSFYDVGKTDDGRGKVVINLKNGYQVSNVSIIDSFGNEVLYELGEDGYYFELYDDVVVSVTYEKLPSNPKTGDNSSLIILSLLLLFSIGYYVITKNININSYKL